MKFRKLSDNQYILRFDFGDAFGDTLREFIAAEKIQSAFLMGLGSVSSVTLGFYDTAREGYDWRTFEGTYEILSMPGNISWLDGKPAYHIHMTLSGHDFSTFAGHFKDCVVGATCEVMLTTTPTKLEREPSGRKELFTLKL